MTSPMVFSIRPAYVAMFRDGSKRYEYRTRRPSVKRGEMVLIYETAPASRIVAEATVQDVLDGAPGLIWAVTCPRSGIDRGSFDRYFDGRSRAVAINLSLSWLRNPALLPPGMSAPQSWARLKGEWRP